VKLSNPLSILPQQSPSVISPEETAGGTSTTSTVENLPTPEITGGAGINFRPILTASPGVEEVKRRIHLILKTDKPEWLFVIGQKIERGIACQSFNYQPGKNALLLFTSGHAANDYIRYNKLHSQVAAMKAEDVQKNVSSWASGGLSAFSLNRCPRCSFIQTVSLEMLSRAETFHASWASTVAIQRWRAESLVRFCSANLAKNEARASLEFLRDHVDCGNPYVHQVIAIKARMENDASAVQFSLQRLAEFGPAFALSNLNPSSDGESLDPKWFDTMAKATMSLMNSYGLLKFPEPEAN
jgi:hypothetical protein